MKMKITIAFADNLKSYRKSKKLSRRALAEKISYSEKAIEKWESGESCPPLELICRLSQMFCCTLEDLIYPIERKTEYFLGIDGGGTKTEFLLEDTSGKCVSHLTLSPSNPNTIGIAQCESILEEGITEVCSSVDRNKVSAFAGLSGGEGNNRIQLHKFFSKFSFDVYDCDGDIENALELTIGDSDGITVIADTGINGFAQKSGRRSQISGWGCLIDSAGSGYNIGRDALEAAMRDIDGRGEKTILRSMIESRLHTRLTEAIPDIYREGKHKIASFAKLTFEAYRNNDATAIRIINRNACAIAEIITAASKKFSGAAAVKTVVCGGLCNSSDILMPIVSSAVPDFINLSFTDEPMVIGAVKRAKKLV